MLVPLDQLAASSAATIEIIQFPCETPGGGTFGFSKSVLASAPKTWPKTVFGTKHLSDLSFLHYQCRRSGAAHLIIVAPPRPGKWRRPNFSDPPPAAEQRSQVNQSGALAACETGELRAFTHRRFYALRAQIHFRRS